MAKFNPFDYPIIFSAPEYVVPSDWAENIPFALFLMDLVRPKILVDLDARSIVPFSTFLQAVSELHLDTKCFGVEPSETWSNSTNHDLRSTFKHHVEQKYGQFSTWIPGQGEDAVHHFLNGSIDILHLKWEADLSYYEKWLPKMSNQGIILFHLFEQDDPSWTSFWKRAQSKQLSFEIPHAHGLKMLAVGAHPAERLKHALLDQDEQTKHEIADFFLWSGNLLVPLFDQAKKDTELERLQAKAYQLEQSNHILRYHKANLETRLQQIQDRLSSVKSQGTVHRIINKLIPPGSRSRVIAGKFKHMLQNTLAARRAYSPSNDPQPFDITIPFEKKETAPCESDQRFMNVYFDLLSRAKGSSDTYVPIAKEKYEAVEAPVKLIAFYLPQFHPIPENDQWWGKGFTEWTNVSKAVPNFAGHYQPRLPDELNFYDLRIPEIQKRQVELAQMYGIYGFCFYYYWFNGKRLLELPLNQFIENKELDFPFCICWGNENWTRRWDGAEQSVLIGQTYSEEEYTAFIRDIASILTDKRYIRIEGKPLLAVYRVNLLVDPQRAVEIWRSECRDLGVGEIYLAAVQSFDIEDPRLYGFDCAIEFPPHNCLRIEAAIDLLNLPLTNTHFTGNVFDYRKAAEWMANKNVPDYVQFKTVMPSWDNTARRQNDSVIFFNSSPTVYRNWLVKTIEHTCTILPQEKRFVFINAWNEWAEGAYLEPDRLYGYAYLQATKEALESAKTLESTPNKQWEN